MISKPQAGYSKTIDEMVGARLLALMTQNGMSSADLAERLGLKPEMVDEYCAGTRRIGATLLMEISRLLGVKVTDFYAGATGFEGQD